MKKLFVGLSIIFLMCLFCGCIAAEELTLAKDISYDPGTRTLSLLVNDNRSSGPETELAEVSFDSIRLENAVYKTLSDSGLPIVFCFVVDTSPTAFSYQTKIPGELGAALAGYRDNKADQYYLVQYDTKVQDAAGPVQNPGSLFDGIKYAGGPNIVGDYSEALIKAVDLLNSHDGFFKKVIILITDGRQTKQPLLQDSGENGLLEKLEDAGYPVYSFGLMQSETESYDEASLNKIQNISSTTGGMFVSYKNNPTPGKAFFDQIIRSGVISGTVPASYGKDSSGPVTLNVKLMKSSGAEIQTLTADPVFPVIKGPEPKQEQEQETNPEPKREQETGSSAEETIVLPTEEAIPVSQIEQVKTMLQDKLGENWAYILGAGLMLIILIILIISIASGNRKSKKDNQGSDSSNPEPETGSEKIKNTPEPKQEKEDASKAYLVYLTDQSNGVTCSTSLRDGQTMIFGRLNDKANGVIGLGGDPHISRRQFTLTNNNEKIILEDLSSENGTFLNGERIIGKSSVSSGDLVRVGGIPGEREFRVSLMEL